MRHGTVTDVAFFLKWLCSALYYIFLLYEDLVEQAGRRVHVPITASAWGVFIALHHPGTVIICLCMCIYVRVSACGHGYLFPVSISLCVCQHKAARGCPVNERGVHAEFGCCESLSVWKAASVCQVQAGKPKKPSLKPEAGIYTLGPQVERVFNSPSLKMY